MGIIDLFYNPNKRLLASLEQEVARINSFEVEIKKLDDKSLRDKTAQFKEKIAVAGGDVERENKILTEIMPEAFAVMREAMKRVWGERHFDVQLIGGLVLHQGKISEMKTGEGKTIVATLPLYLNSLTGRGAHLVTVNDYLSKHQGEGMGQVFEFLGLSVGIIQSNQESFRYKKTKDYKHYSECDGSNLEPCSRKDAYACDITYGTNNEFGFDYLRDNMAPSLELCSQRELNFAIVDEVDSILIDEARTPLIISASAEESTSMYMQFAAIVPQLKIVEDYLVDEKEKTVILTDSGIKKIETALGVKNIYESNGISYVHHVEQALKAHALFKINKDYVVRDGEIMIVDEFTGRLMVGRRYSEGLHQAIEAKEGVEVKRESQTLATISFQNLFRLYNKLAGMTGTAATEAEEFYKIYKLDVVEIPTNKPVSRKDFADKIYKTEKAKYAAIVEDVREYVKRAQPVLIGTVSVEKNELVSKLLKRAGIKHEILNAKNHEREARIIVKAGLPGAVTVATNMAGRGTDIKLGDGVRELGGLHVIGTERHEARRIDNQLRGRAGRQGDNGSSLFYVSMEDDLMRIFGGEKMKNLMDSLGLPDDVPIENSMISRSIESAQKKVEGYNFDTRKHLVEYDDVINKHREVIYRKRRKILELAQGLEILVKQPGVDAYGNTIEAEVPYELKGEILSVIDEEIDHICSSNVEDPERINEEMRAIIGDVKVESIEPEMLKAMVRELYSQREEKFSSEVMRQLEQAVYLRTIDVMWVEHLTTMDELRTGIGLRGYGQRDPLVEYKQEAYRLFDLLLNNIDTTVANTIFKVEMQVSKPAPKEDIKVDYISPSEETFGAENHDKEDLKVARQIEVASKKNNNAPKINSQGKSVFDRMKESAGNGTTTQAKNVKKIGRNDLCSCGSGKKYKKCCGKI
ncbi:MAG: preprotein translocase subunit SecA [bacterium]